MTPLCHHHHSATMAALRPLARHNSNASCLYSSVYLALLRAGFDNCVFMWASFRVLTLSPLSVKSMQPYSDPLCSPLQFDKRSQLFIGAHDETFSVVTVCISNPDCSPALRDAFSVFVPDINTNRSVGRP